MKTARFDIDGGSLVKFEGAMDSSLDIRALARSLGGTVVFDLDGIERVTSYGAGHWVRGLRELKVDYFALARCRPNIVTYLNMVRGFSGGGEILSLYAPYMCTQCDATLDHYIDLSSEHHIVQTLELPKLRCNTCKAPMEFDELPKSYFAYVASQPPPKLTPLAERLLTADQVAKPDMRLSVRMDVSGKVHVIWLQGRLDKRERLHRKLIGLEGRVIVDFGALSTVTAAGLDKLRAALRSSGATTLYYTRVSPDQAAEVAGWLRNDRGDALASLHVEASCQSCFKPSKIEIIRNSAGHPEPLPFRCEACGSLIQHPDGPLPSSVKNLRNNLPEPVMDHLDVDGLSATAEQPALSPPPTAQLGRYRLLSKLAEGGMGVVYRAHDPNFERDVVVKILSDSVENNKRQNALFEQEAKTIAALEHPWIVPIYDYGIEAGERYMVLRYMQGGSLRDRIKGGPLAAKLALDTLRQVGSALDYIHNRSIVHRDLKPENVLFDLQGYAYLADFGIARGTQKQGMITIAGTPFYMSPEQWLGEGVLDARSDLYSLGVIAFEMLTGQLPGTCTVPFTKSNKPVLGAHQINSQLSKACDDILQQCITHEVAKRFRTAAEFVEALDAALHSQAEP